MRSQIVNRHGADRPPNVIWIIADQLRAQSLGYRGDPNVRTPTIDNLARRGVRFDNAVAGAPWCSPFRASLLTSTYPHQNGVTRTPSLLDPSIPTITAPFREAGYHTAWIGKWHVDGSNSGAHFVPPEHRGGFAYWRGYENNNSQEEGYVCGGYADPSYPGYDPEDETPVRLPGYETDSLTDIFVDHLRRHVETNYDDDGYQPFFATLSVQPPHSPYVGPGNGSETGLQGLSGGGSGRGPGWPPISPAHVTLRPNVPQVDRIRETSRIAYAGYAAMVENIDWNVGRILRALRDLDVDRETWIIFFSDHGDMLGSHGQRQKSSPWEESIRIPFIISRVAGNQVISTGITDSVMNHVDIAPTTLGLCDIRVPEWAQGYDYSHRCRADQTDKRDGTDLRGEEPESAYLQQIPRKFHAHTVNRAWRGVVTHDGWKYICTPGNDWLLHNTAEDPFEQANLCYNTAYYRDKQRCHAELERWIRETTDDFDLPDITSDRSTP